MSMSLGDRLRVIAAYVDERALAGIALVMVGPLRYEMVIADSDNADRDAQVLGLSIYQATNIKAISAKDLAMYGN